MELMATTMSVEDVRMRCRKSFTYDCWRRISSSCRYKSEPREPTNSSASAARSRARLTVEVMMVADNDLALPETSSSRAKAD